MVIRKRKKNTKMRGRSWHGWGSKKKHRGAGNRGGRGNAGRGKRSDHKKPSYMKEKNFLGQKGFVMHRKRKQLAVNLGFIQEHINQLVSEGKVEKKDNIYIVDMKKLGWDKVLGSGQIKFRLQITAAQFSKLAEEKIKKAGGQVTVA